VFRSNVCRPRWIRTVFVTVQYIVQFLQTQRLSFFIFFVPLKPSTFLYFSICTIQFYLCILLAASIVHVKCNVKAVIPTHSPPPGGCVWIRPDPPHPRGLKKKPGHPPPRGSTRSPEIMDSNFRGFLKKNMATLCWVSNIIASTN